MVQVPYWQELVLTVGGRRACPAGWLVLEAARGTRTRFVGLPRMLYIGQTIPCLFQPTAISPLQPEATVLFRLQFHSAAAGSTWRQLAKPSELPWRPRWHLLQLGQVPG